MATKITTLIFAIFICSPLKAYFIVPFWQEDFSLGELPAGWETMDISGNEEDWKHCDDFNLCPPISFFEMEAFPNERFRSASMENGYAFIAPFQTSGSHNSALMTNAIDCSDNGQVFLTFNTFIVAHESDLETNAVIEVRQGLSGDWETFTVFPKLNNEFIEADPKLSSFDEPLIKSYNGQQVCIDISQVAAFQEEIFIRWRWDWTGGEDFFWLVDDVNLLDENPVNENAIWGMESTEGGFDGGLNGWTVPPAFGCEWEWGQHGFIDTDDLNDKADLFSCSCSAQNGVAALNALCNPNPSFSLAELVSPTIDLSFVSLDKKLGVRFTQTGVIGNVANNDLPLTSIMVSTDGGETFIDTIFLNIVEPFQTPFCNTKLVPLPDEVIGADQFVFKFVFSGDSFFWMIDDVRVVELYENDLRISEDYFAVPPNYSMPMEMNEPIGFRSEVQNRGCLDQENVSLAVEIHQDDTHEMIFSDTVLIGALNAGEVSDIVSFDKVFLPDPGHAYTGYYKVESGNEDEYKIDNIKSFQFKTSGNTFSKQKDRFSINGGFRAFGNEFRYEVGTCFHVPSGNSALAHSISFALANGRQLAFGDVIENVGINLYKWKEDLNGDLMANEDEIDTIGLSFYEVNDASLQMWDAIEVVFDSLIQLEGGAYYIAAVDYFSPVTIYGQQIPMFISASEEINYNAMFDHSETSGVPRFVSVLRTPDELDFQTNAWGLLRVPFIQINATMITDTKEEVNDQSMFSIFPNPNTGQFYLKMAGETHLDKFAYEIYDICGRLALPRQNVEGYVSQLPIDASQLGNGLYNLRVVFGDQAVNQLFLKTK